MIRSFAVALVTIIVVAVLGSSREIAAWQQNPPPSQVPMQFTGGMPGSTFELFLNAGKVADVAINTTGEGMSVLDLSNLGKVQLQVYVDVCQDGKVVKVQVASGQPTPEDQNCRRRVVGGAWWSDCGVTRITLDLTRFGMRTIGCGSFITSPRGMLTAAGGAIVVGGLLIAGGGGSTAPVATSQPSVTFTTPPANTTAPPTNTAPPSTPPPSTATGNYTCAACAVQSDPSRHDPTLRVCSGVTSTFGVAVGSLTIRHPAPFIEVSGANYNTETGAFDLTGRGSIAGFSNVSVRAVGTVNNSTGRITMNYTMGTAGEFPGGQPITYSITLQKQ